MTEEEAAKYEDAMFAAENGSQSGSEQGSAGSAGDDKDEEVVNQNELKENRKGISKGRGNTYALL